MLAVYPLFILAIGYSFTITVWQNCICSLLFKSFNMKSDETEKAIGPICESTDFTGKDHFIRKVCKMI